MPLAGFGAVSIGKFNVHAIHLLISALYMRACMCIICIISLCLPFLFPFSLLFFLLTFTYLLFSRIWTRSVSRPEVVGGDRTWV